MTAGDQHYDPTGLIRVHLRGVSPLMGPSCGAISHDNVNPVSKAKTKMKTKIPWGISPIWSAPDGAQVRLASFQKPGMRLLKGSVTEDQVSFVAVGEIPGPGGLHHVEESITLTGNKVNVSVCWTSPTNGSLAVSYPILTTDGRTETTINLKSDQIELRRPDSKALVLHVTTPRDAILKRTGLSIAQPNGMIEPLLIQGSDTRIDFTIESKP